MTVLIILGHIVFDVAAVGAMVMWPMGDEE